MQIFTILDFILHAIKNYVHLLRDIFNIPTAVVNIASEYCIEYTETVMTAKQAISFSQLSSKLPDIKLVPTNECKNVPFLFFGFRDLECFPNTFINPLVLVPNACISGIKSIPSLNSPGWCVPAYLDSINSDVLDCLQKHCVTILERNHKDLFELPFKEDQIEFNQSLINGQFLSNREWLLGFNEEKGRLILLSLQMSTQSGTPLLYILKKKQVLYRPEQSKFHQNIIPSDDHIAHIMIKLLGIAFFNNFWLFATTVHAIAYEEDFETIK